MNLGIKHWSPNLGIQHWSPNLGIKHWSPSHADLRIILILLRYHLVVIPLIYWDQVQTSDWIRLSMFKFYPSNGKYLSISTIKCCSLNTNLNFKLNFFYWSNQFKKKNNENFALIKEILKTNLTIFERHVIPKGNFFWFEQFNQKKS